VVELGLIGRFSPLGLVGAALGTALLGAVVGVLIAASTPRHGGPNLGVAVARAPGALPPVAIGLPVTPLARVGADAARQLGSDQSAAVRVLDSDGKVLGAAGVVSFTGISREANTLIFHGVSVLGGEVSADQVVVPSSGFSEARVDGLRVAGTPRPTGVNLAYPLPDGGYVVVLQEAVSGTRQGLVALRVHTTRDLGAGHPGGDVLVGASPTSGGSETTVLALGQAPAPRAADGYSYPLSVRGLVVGCPFVPGSTHSPTAPPDNLASDNAVDLAVPVGTPVLATADGTIGSLIGPLDSNDPHLAGLRVHLDTATDHFYYAHLSRIDVAPGDRVRQGQTIGLSGEAAGVAHLHFAQDLGDPAHTIGESGACALLPRPNEPWG
jgi:hypothetical protein